jgi:2-polyprenyl-3-methyl-5-hydroxy-6-metoxy-1,4-benzoquinol methylase
MQAIRTDRIDIQRKIASDASGGVSNESIYSKMIDMIKKHSLEGHALDFGAGIGNLTMKLDALKQFRSITAVDLMQRPDNIFGCTIDWRIWDLNHPLEFDSETFDLVISSEVIEHLENPRAIIREWFRLLKPNGTLIFSTPNNESWRAILALVVQGHFVHFGDRCYPAHITALVRKDIQRIFVEAGFSNCEISFNNFGGIPKMPNLSWQQFSGGLLQGLRYSDNVIVIAKK